MFDEVTADEGGGRRNPAGGPDTTQTAGVQSESGGVFGLRRRLPDRGTRGPSVTRAE